VAFPNGVVTEIRPDPVPDGTLVAIDVVVAELTMDWVMLNFNLLLAGAGSKLLPAMATAVPAVPIVGVNPVMVGAPVEPTTVKAVLLVAEPAGVVTVMGPVVAPAGTLVTIFVAVAEDTGATTPLNLAVFWLAVVENPVPWMVTGVPTAPLSGLN
jgi:hypothetical protein